MAKNPAKVSILMKPLHMVPQFKQPSLLVKVQKQQKIYFSSMLLLYHWELKLPAKL